jgi:hypothetical protein
MRKYKKEISNLKVETKIKTMKKPTAVILYTDGTMKKVTPQDGKNFSLAELQEIVGGFIEIVPAKQEGKVLVIDEEGKNKGKIANVAATAFYPFGDEDPIAGNALICDQVMVE